MSDFSQLLSCHIHSKDIKTYALAQYCGLDRSNMYKIINGKRKPSSRELVLKICKFMQLSHAEQKEMEQAYEITLIGHDTYYRRKAVIDFFNNFCLSKLNLPVLSELNTEILFEKGSVTLNTMAEVNRSLLYIISLEAKKSNGTIDLLVQPDCDFLMNILAAENYDCSQTTIRHIICLNNSTSESSTYPNYNLHCLEKILPLYSNVDKYNCFYYYDHIDSKCSKFTLFPYVIITSQFACLLTGDMTQGILTNAPESLTLFKDIFNQYLSMASPLLRPINDVTEQISYLNNISHVVRSGYSFQMVPCLTPYLTHDILDKYIIQELPNRSEFIQAMDNYIKVFLSSYMTPDNITYIFSLNGVKKFLDTGRVSEYPYDIYHPLEMTDRIHLIRKLMLNLPIQNYRVLKKDIGHLDNEIFLQVTQPMGYIMFSTPQDHRLIYLDIEEPGLLYTFWDFCETLDDALFYTTTEAIEILRDLIEQYKELR